MRAVVTGAGRGLGLELVRQLVRKGAAVEAAVRKPENAPELLALAREAHPHVRVHECDVSTDSSVNAFAAGLQGQSIDLLINNAALPPVRDNVLAIQPGDELLRTLNVNAVGALRVTRAVLPGLRQGSEPKIIHIGSYLGSAHGLSAGDTFGYRMSKAALHMASCVLARGLKDEGVLSVVIDPGWLRTRMGGPRATLPVADSAAAILRLLDRLTLRHTGSFLDYRGRRLRA